MCSALRASSRFAIVLRLVLSCSAFLMSLDAAATAAANWIPVNFLGSSERILSVLSGPGSSTSSVDFWLGGLISACPDGMQGVSCHWCKMSQWQGPLRKTWPKRFAKGLSELSPGRAWTATPPPTAPRLGNSNLSCKPRPREGGPSIVQVPTCDDPTCLARKHR